MIRAFIAITLPDPILQRCQEISDRLRGLKLNGRFPKSESIHLTLKFLGNIKEEQVPTIAQVLENTAGESLPFHLKIQGVGAFPHIANPRVVWVAVEHNEALSEMQKRIEDRLQGLGFPKENRKFHPHLTLARLKSRKNLKDLIQYIQGEGVREKAGTVTVKEIHLYQSVLRPQGAEYRKLVTARLGEQLTADN